MFKKIINSVLNSTKKMQFKKSSSVNYLGSEEMKKTVKTILMKIEKRIEIMEAIETSVDEKLAIFERLMNMFETHKIPANLISSNNEICNLTRKGLRADDIADILNIPKGEVELVVNFYR